MVMAIDAVIEALRAGDRVMITHPDPNKTADKITYGLVVSGRNIGSRIYAKIKDQLEPVADGLFPDEGSQSYRWRGD